MKKINNLDVFMLSKASVFLGQAMDTTMDNSAHWILNDGSQIVIDFNTKELQFIDWVGDDKTYYSLVGLACSANFDYDLYFSEN